MFSLNKEDIKKILIGILGIILLSKLMTGELKASLINLLFTIPGLFLAISVHEAAHAFAAYKLGDDTAKNEGRITLNPLKHIDPVGLLSLFVFKIGWGKPVEYNPIKINVAEIKKAEAKIALAGPLSNFILAIILTIILAVITRFAPVNNIIFTICLMINIAISLNIGLGIFNLIPFPPLDGSKIFYKLYEGEFGRLYRNNQFILSIIFMGLLLSGVIPNILSSVLIAIERFMKDLIFKIIV